MTIERSQLQKEIWEDEGVIKAKKKLKADPNINIVVVQGKEYKPEVGA